MEITLIRHGRSSHINDSPMTFPDFNEWVKKYDSYGILENETFPSGSAEIVRSASMLITSDLQRSIESARLLNPAAKIKAELLFREAELPSTGIGPKSLKLKPKYWAVLLRVLWFLGYGKGCESYPEANARAKEAALKLISYAKEHQSAILVGHGIFNQMIAKELQKMGWKGQHRTNSKHWHETTYKI
ncbi:histidine phosphatase family protein [Cytobacillus sp. NCCP-133]|uniref:histidine phosphatase family protein n=1 Tax=Cytobacillus sp. NCCP-133 TaxID=766848 RepID=UPI0022328D3B|nr:phosphoglycerate mutase family protein [Cytobacillus sp. NCCP-133]GLB59568.1 hypothetical protein NCCP133_17010 [Cytobacillus sp. NCCP-133]